MTGRLIERSGARAGTVHLLGTGVTTIGRGEANALALANAHVSLRHARVTWDGARYLLEDLGSTNGTFVNRPGSGTGNPPWVNMI